MHPADIARSAIDMIRSVRSAQTSDYPLHAVPMDQISMELFNIADTANCNWGVLITMYPDAIGWGACIWILSLLTERFAGVLTLSLRRNFESGIHTCSILRAFASLITIWNFPLQAVFRLFYRIIFGLLRWIHLPPGNPPTTVSVIVYADTAAELAVTHTDDATCDFSPLVRKLSYVRVGHERLQYAVERRTTGTPTMQWYILPIDTIVIVGSADPKGRGPPTGHFAGSLQFEVVRTVLISPSVDWPHRAGYR